MVAFAKFIFVSNRVDHRIETVNVSPHSYGFSFNPGIDFRNRLDLRIDALRGAVNLAQKIGEGLNPERNPLAERRIGKISQLQIVLRIESALLLECRDRIVIEAGPRVFPAVEVSHPVRNVDINSVNSRRRNLPHALHVGLPPLGSVGTDPNILISWPDPERAAPSEDRGLAGDLALQPVGMILGQRVRHLIPMRSDALGPGNVDESVIARLVRRFGHLADRLQFLFWIEKTLVAPGNVIVDLNPEHVALLRLARNLLRVAALQTISADADVVRPVLFFGIRRRDQPQREQE